jgi:hypothetical protein
LIDQRCQARLLVVRAEPAGTGEGGDAVQSAPGNLGQGVRVTLAGQWRDSFRKFVEGGLQFAGRAGQPHGDTWRALTTRNAGRLLSRSRSR